MAPRHAMEAGKYMKKTKKSLQHSLRKCSAREWCRQGEGDWLGRCESLYSTCHTNFTQPCMNDGSVFPQHCHTAFTQLYHTNFAQLCSY